MKLLIAAALSLLALVDQMSLKFPPPTLPTSCVSDDAARDSSFVAFRKELLRIIAARDAAKLFTVTDPEIGLGVDEDSGIPALKRKYNPEDPNSRIWSDLEETLLLGAHSWDENIVSAPSLTCKPGSAGDDELTTACVIARDVAVRAEPSLGGAVIQRLSCERVAIDATDLRLPAPRYESGWMNVVIGNRWGYMDERFVRFAGATSNFLRVKGQWRWVSLSWPD